MAIEGIEHKEIDLEKLERNINKSFKGREVVEVDYNPEEKLLYVNAGSELEKDDEYLKSLLVAGSLLVDYKNIKVKGRIGNNIITIEREKE